MRLAFLGSGDFGLPTLKALCRHHRIVAVISQPDRPAGRRRQLTPTPISRFALENNLPLHRAENVNTPEFVQTVADLKPDAAVVIAFGQKINPPLVAALGQPVINLHASLLPRYRGAAPINRAIMQGETATGNSVIAISPRMDAGEIYHQSQTPIDPLETAEELHDRLAAMGPEDVLEVLARAAAGTLVGRAQDESKVTQAPKLSKSDGRIDWSSQGADEIRRLVHGLTPWPGVRVTWLRQADPADQPLLLRRVRSQDLLAQAAPPGQFVQPDRVATVAGQLELLEVQLPGKRPMSINQFMTGHRVQAGDRLY